MIVRILGVLAALVLVALLALGAVLSHNGACGPAPAVDADAPLMSAFVYRCYGSPEVLALEEVEKPSPAKDEVLVKVHAAAVNPYDWRFMRGEPYLMRLESGVGTPTDIRLGVDFSGTVEAVGDSVTRFEPGDQVFGGAAGAFGEYVAIRESRALAHKPPGVTFEEAASLPIAAISALQGLRDKGQLKAGQKVLINGASGGVGTFAVQIAKHFGAEVTGVCSTRNLEMVRSLGADHVIDYTQEDFAAAAERYDLILDNVGNRNLSDYRRVLTPNGTLVMIGGSKGRWIGPFINPLKALFLSPFVDHRLSMLLAQLNHEDLTFLAELMQAGEMTAVIDRRYALDELPAAIQYSEEGHARGKIIVNVLESGAAVSGPEKDSGVSAPESFSLGEPIAQP